MPPKRDHPRRLNVRKPKEADIAPWIRQLEAKEQQRLPVSASTEVEVEEVDSAEDDPDYVDSGTDDDDDDTEEDEDDTEEDEDENEDDDDDEDDDDEDEDSDTESEDDRPSAKRVRRK